MSAILPAGKYTAILFNTICTGKELFVHALINSNMPFDLAYLTVPHPADWERVQVMSGRFGQTVQIAVSDLQRGEDEISEFLYGRLISLQP